MNVPEECVSAIEASEDVQNNDKNEVDQKKNGTQVDDALAIQIRRQCEFYFSDVNIMKDLFLMRLVKSCPGGWVKLEAIEKFKRMQSLTKDHEAVVDSLNKSEKLEVSSDGTMVRRRDPLPEWDSSVYYRSVIISDFPENTYIDSDELTGYFTGEVAAPSLVRIFSIGRKVTPDLKRSQILHPQLGTKLSVIVEFPTRPQASKAISAAAKKWPNAYVRLLSFGSNPKKNKKKEVVTPKEPLPPRRPIFLNRQEEVIKVVHLREPVAPQSDDTAGFLPGWRDLLKLERLAVTNAGDLTSPLLAVPAAPFLPPDSAIIQVAPFVPMV